MTSPQETAVGGVAALLTVRILDPQRVYADVPGRFVLLPVGDNATRLLVRESLAIPERASWTWEIRDPMHFAVERRMLEGIQERAEGQALVPAVIQAAAHVGALAYGWRWWPPYLSLAPGVAFVLILAPDSFAAFGLLFVLVAAQPGRRGFPGTTRNIRDRNLSGLARR